MATRQPTDKRLSNGTTQSNRKIVPAPSIHSHTADDQKTTQPKNFKQEKLTAGITASNNYDYLEAVKQFCLIKPDTTTSLYLCGCARLELKYYSQAQEAIVDFTQCLQLASQTTQPPFALEIWYKRALAYHNIGKHDEAIKDYTEFIHRCRSLGKQSESDLYRGLIGRGLTYQAMYDLNMALADINEANILTDDSNPYCLCCRAGVYVSKHEYKKATEDLEQASEMGIDQDVEALLQRAIVFSELGKHDAALKDLKKALPLSNQPSQQAEICYRSGLCEHALNDQDEAFRYFGRAVNLHPYHASAHFYLGRMQAERGQYKDALRTLTRAHDLAPQQGDILLERANVNRQLDKLDDASDDQKHGIQLNSTSLSIVMKLTRRIKKLREEIDHNGTSPHSHLKLAMAYDGLISEKKNSLSKMEYYKEAMNEYKAAIKSDTKYLYPQASALLALCHKKMNDLIRAHELHLEFYEILAKHEGAAYHWETYLLEIKQKMESGKLEPHLDENAVSKLIHMEVNRRKRAADEETLEYDTEDSNKNQWAFYEQLRFDLSNVLAAVSMLSHDRESILHSMEGTKSDVGKIVEMLCEALTSVSDIESKLNSGSKVNLKVLQKANYDIIKMRLKVLGNVGDMTDQLDVAQLVARHLCTRYRSQLICLKTYNHDMDDDDDESLPLPSPWWKCCGSKQRVSSKKQMSSDGKKTIDSVATFALAFIIHSINSESIRVSSTEKSARKDALATALVLAVSRAHRNMETGFFPSLRYGKTTLPIELAAVFTMLEESKKGPDDQVASVIEWELYEFFRAPGIYYYSDSDTGKVRHYGSGPSMKPDIYGFRLGTREEADVFKKLNKNKEIPLRQVKN